MNLERTVMPNGDVRYKCPSCPFVCYTLDKRGVQLGVKCSELIISLKDVELQCKLDKC